MEGITLISCKTLISVFLFLACVANTVHGQAAAGTRVGFYDGSCPTAEAVVKSTVQTHFSSNPTIASPGFLRMHFHDWFVHAGNGRGVLVSDQKLRTDASSRTFVQKLLGVRGLLGLKFNVEFGKSMVKMSNIGVKTGSQGEIRTLCSAIN
ncbi:cationic peroxidase 2 [Ziziphus jujuba]|uniref:peroxidase n=1 Tax=Ziziphus jujuba TaxID=326968 RepID=A0ABM3IAX2_ZIZJJ|nr:cationic peroxidase 2 [Ziziphus jujuba]